MSWIAYLMLLLIKIAFFSSSSSLRLLLHWTLVCRPHVHRVSFASNRSALCTLSFNVLTWSFCLSDYIMRFLIAHRWDGAVYGIWLVNRLEFRFDLVTVTFFPLRRCLLFLSVSHWINSNGYLILMNVSRMLYIATKRRSDGSFLTLTCI